MAGWLSICLVGARDDVGGLEVVGLEVGGLKGTAGNGGKELATILGICDIGVSFWHATIQRAKLTSSK